MSALSTPEATRHARADRFSAFRRNLSTPPGWLRALSVAIVVGALFTGLLSSLSLSQKASGIDKIGNRTVPAIIDAQRIHTALLDADRSAANSYLYGGEGTDPAHQRYLADIRLATEALEQAAQHTAYGDEVAEPLVTAMSGLNRYTALVERARTNSRLGFPVGQAYLTAASKLMHAEILPAIDQLNSINAAHLEKDYASATASTTTLAVILGGGLSVLAILLYCQIYLARRFKRRFNFLLILATFDLVAIIASGTITVITADSKLVAAKDSHYTQLHRLWAGRSLVNDANLNETLSLIARGSGAEFDAAFTASTRNFKVLLSDATAAATTDDERRTLADVRRAYEEFLAVDVQIRELVAAGHRDDAVRLALGTDTGQLGQKFALLDAALGRAIDSYQRDFDSHIASAEHWLFGQNFAFPIIAFVISMSTLFGVQPRIREYGG